MIKVLAAKQRQPQQPLQPIQQQQIQQAQPRQPNLRLRQRAPQQVHRKKLRKRQLFTNRLLLFLTLNIH